jgi:hypothetical protein
VLSALPAASTIAKTMSNVGQYDIIASGGVAQNYTLSYTNGQFSINKATLKVYATDATRNYGDANPDFITNITGYKGADDITVLDVMPTYLCAANASSTPANFSVIYSGGSDNNYQFDYATTVGKLTVSKTPLSVSVQNATKEYGSVNPQFVISYSGFKNNETANALSTLPTATTTALTTSNVGSYIINVSGGTSTNYSFSYTGGKLDVTKAALNITAENDTIKFGDAIPKFKLLYSGFKNEDNESVLQNLPTVQCTASDKSPIGNYDITLQGGSDKNYEYKLTNGVLLIQENTGINDVSVQNVVLYPIPAKEVLYIKSDAQISKVEIYSLQGQVLQIAKGESIQSVNVSMLNNGSYFIRLHNNSGIVTKMFIKE